MRVLAKPAFSKKESNPYTWLLNKTMENMDLEVYEFSIKQCLTKKYDIFHIHWPEWHLGNSKIFDAITKTIALLLLIALMRLRGTKVIWTVHNLRAHQTLYPVLENGFWRIFSHQLNGYISLSKTGMKAAKDNFPNLRNIPGFVVPHNHYREAYPNNLSFQEARSALEISPSTKVLLFFGRLQPYKNVPAFIRAFNQVAKTNILLYIAGSFSPKFPKFNEEVKREAALNPRIRLHEEFISNEDIQIYFNAANLVICPFSEILNSGSALLALSFDRPVLVPLMGSLVELQEQVGKEWVFTYTGDITPSKIEEALNWESNIPRSNGAPLERLDTEVIARKTIDVYRVISES